MPFPPLDGRTTWTVQEKVRAWAIMAGMTPQQLADAIREAARSREVESK